MRSTAKITKDEYEVDIKPTFYRNKIGNVLFLTSSRSNLCLSVGICARDQAEPLKSHLKAVKKILRYVNDTNICGFLFTKDSNVHLAEFSDTNHTNCINDKENTYGDCFFINYNIFSGNN